MLQRSHGGCRRGRAARGVALAVVCLAVGAGAQEAPRRVVGEYELKAAFLVKLVRFVDWPEGAQPGPEGVVLGVLGQDPFGGALDAVAAEVDPPVRIVRGASLADLPADCHAVFVSASERANLGAVLRQLRDRPVLTVGDALGFEERGGMIELFLSDRSIRFAVNLDAAKAVGLRFDMKLLKLATSVRHAAKKEGPP